MGKYRLAAEEEMNAEQLRRVAKALSFQFEHNTFSIQLKRDSRTVHVRTEHVDFEFPNSGAEFADSLREAFASLSALLVLEANKYQMAADRIATAEE